MREEALVMQASAGLPAGPVRSVELLELAEHFRLALRAGGLGTWHWDMATGVTTWDAAMEELFGLAPGTFDGTFDTWVALLHPDDRDQCLATLAEALEVGGPYELEHRVLRPDGEIRWLVGRGAVTRHPDGRVAGTIGCTGDVTARKQFEMEAQQRVLEAEGRALAERRRRLQLEFLASVNEVALATLDHRELMRAAANAAVPRLGDWCSVHFLPEQGSTPEVELAHAGPDGLELITELLEQRPHDPAGTMGVQAVLRSGITELIVDFEQTMLDLLRERAAGVENLQLLLDTVPISSMITVPLVTKRGIIGVMQFVASGSGRQYDTDDVTLAEAAAGRIAAALDSAWLAGQQRRIASTLQAALLPPRLPAIDGVSVAVRYWVAGTAVQVGGDFYDVFPLSESEWAVVIGDVCGTGPDAAAVTAIARHTIRAAAVHGVHHTAVLDWLNDALHAGGRNLFCTAVYSTLEHGADGWRYTSVSGGHPLPLLVRAGEVSTVGLPGTLLGVLPTVQADRSSIGLLPGDTLLLYTDGVTDVAPPYALDDVEWHRLVADAVSAGDSAQQVVDRLEQAIAGVLPMEARHDDLAVVVLRIR